MKTVIATAIVWMAATAACYGQDNRAIRAGSAEAQRELANQIEENRQRVAEWKRVDEAGRRLFGADDRWTGGRESEFAGTLRHKHPPDFQIGDWGCTDAYFKVISKVSTTECLVLPRYKGAEVMLIRGLDMSKVTDGVQFVLQHPVVIQDTYSYTAVSGGQKTVLVLERDDKKFAEIVANQRAATEALLFRTWTDSGGTFNVNAKFLKLANNKDVNLQKKDGKEIQVLMSDLSREDQKWVRDELKSQREKEKNRTEKELKIKKRNVKSR